MTNHIIYKKKTTESFRKHNLAVYLQSQIMRWQECAGETSLQEHHVRESSCACMVSSYLETKIEGKLVRREAFIWRAAQKHANRRERTALAIVHVKYTHIAINIPLIIFYVKILEFVLAKFSNLWRMISKYYCFKYTQLFRFKWPLYKILKGGGGFLDYKKISIWKQS